MLSVWLNAYTHINSYSNRLVGDVLLLTGFLSYSGPFNQEFRTSQQKVWCKELMSRSIPFTAELNLTAMLVDNATVSSTTPNALHVHLSPLVQRCHFCSQIYCLLFFCSFQFSVLSNFLFFPIDIIVLFPLKCYVTACVTYSSRMVL